MNSLHSLVNNMKRKRAGEDTIQNVTSSSNTTTGAKKFQRRGEARQLTTAPTDVIDSSDAQQIDNNNTSINTTIPTPTTKDDQELVQLDKNLDDATTNEQQQQTTSTQTTIDLSKSELTPQEIEDKKTEQAVIDHNTAQSAQQEQEQQQNKQALELTEIEQRLMQLKQQRAEKFRFNRFPNDFEHPAEYLDFGLKRYLWFWEEELDAKEREIAKYQQYVQLQQEKMKTHGQHFMQAPPGGMFFTERDILLHKHTKADYEKMKNNFKPLFNELKRLIKTNTLPKKEDGEKIQSKVTYDILFGLCDVIKFCQTGDYLASKQEFYELTIGDALWPIGLPRVGIHERKTRAKIESYNVKHIMKDPVVKDYMQSIKQVLGYIEAKFPAGENPSKV